MVGLYRLSQLISISAVLVYKLLVDEIALPFAGIQAV
jgi:hypothetical protein